LICQHGACTIHSSLADQENWTFVVITATTLALIANFALGYIVYFNFHSHICTDEIGLFTRLFDAENSGIAFHINAVGSAAMSICVLSCIPLVHFFLRELSFSIYNDFRGENVPSDEMPDIFFYGHLVFWALPTILAIILPDAIMIINFVGSLCCSIHMIILPVLADFEMNGGMWYFFSFGFIEKKAEKDAQICENCFDVKDFGRMVLLNTILIFGFVIIGVSFNIFGKPI
jgi:hypothetical protein